MRPGQGAGAVALGGGRATNQGTMWTREACMCESALWLLCGVGLIRGLGVEDEDLGEAGTMIWVRSDDGSLGMEVREERIRGLSCRWWGWELAF